MKTFCIQDLTVRDGNQSLLATRMEREDILSLASALDKVGFYSLEVWGGATFDSAYRFLHQSAWDNLREIRQAAPKTKLSMLLRGQNIVGYRHYDNDILERFIRLTIENGIDIIRCFDALNDVNNVRNAFSYIKKHGAHLEAALAYTVSSIHTIEYFVDLVRKYEEMGADSICIKDMSGIILPDRARELITALKQVTDLPITLHSHTTAGRTTLVMVEALKAGVDCVDGCISPFSGGTAHLADETLFAIADELGRPYNIDKEALSEAYEVADKIADKYIKKGNYRTRSLIPNPKILEYEIPGGMLSNLLSQLEEQGTADRMNEVLQEVPQVREDMGCPPLVTPLSQMIGTQAVLNVLLGERYKVSPNEIKTYLTGGYGRPPGKVNAEVRRKILGSDQALIPADPNLLEPEYDKNFAYLENFLGRKPLEEEVVAFTIFPDPLKEYMQQDEPGQAQEKLEKLTRPQVEAKPEKAASPSSGIKTYRITLAGEEHIVELEELV
ncbi:MAG: pyruvate carboxylase subunit B [Eubacteriales bacterium]|nr:pyruvate carboxylase subunit B [Eubacteriales bacterium]MDD4324134.1 pyruvate carboxylase subunit B [Eubacteriales bacterium]MDD4541147.1 pyruvate carboxylase subunit B [Eubacteriales bacterium]